MVHHPTGASKSWSVSWPPCSSARHGAPMAITEFGADNLLFSSGLLGRARNHAVALRGRRRGVKPSLFVVFLRVREGFGSHAFSGLRMQFSGVCCCSFTLLSSTPMSAPSTPLLSRLVQMSCTHQHANVRLRYCVFLHTLTCVTRASLSQGISGRYGRATKAANDSSLRIN